jgi:glycosyltransferase involved in cell wall biosynthesis
MDTVSVIIPVYNRADAIERCLDSVFNQTYPAIEVIVIDDGSTDDLAALLAPVMSKIKFIRQDNQGQGAARNIGVKAASGHYLAFLDSDDWWAPEKLLEQMVSIKKSGFVWGHMKTLVVATNDGTLVNDKGYFGDWYRGRRSGIVAQDLLQTNFICTSSVLVEKNVLINSGGFCTDRSVQHFEDYELWLRLAVNYPLDYCETPAVYYVKHDSVSALGKVIEQIEKNDLVMRGIANSNVETYPKGAIERRRYYYREHLFRLALRQGRRKVARTILREMWHFYSYFNRNLLNTCLLFTPAPILKREK